MHLEHFAESQADPHLGQQLDRLNLHFWTFAQAGQARRRQAGLHRPARTETAEKCHQHIALLPGTDGALALG
jgi:anaerobic selenocysteine-containing dehydrogenase